MTTRARVRPCVLLALACTAGAKVVFAVAILWLVAAGSASADPCRAIPDKGPMPAYVARGMTFKGPVVYVGDGDSLCVAVGSRPQSPDNWVEVRLADFYAPELSKPGGREAKAALERLVMGRRTTCFAQHRSHDRVVAVCRINGRSVAAQMRSYGVAEGGRR